MTEPTDADRAKAAEVERRLSYPVMHARDGRVDVIAAALAAERAAAVADLRARVEAVAEELDGDLDDYGYAIRNGLVPSPGDRLRAAVTDTTGDPA